MSHDPNDCYDFDSADTQDETIAKRLRKADAYNKNHNVRDPLHLEAAKEIERLREAQRQNSAMLSALKMVSGMDLHHEVLAVVDAAIASAEGK